VTDFAGLLAALRDAGVDFIVVGGFAGTLHGSAVPTRDLHVVYGRDSANIDRLVSALTPMQPYLRGAPPGLPFRWDRETVERGLNFTLTTRLGAIDLLGEIAGGGDYRALRADAETFTIFGGPCLCLGLRKLIATKRAEAIADLEALLDERGG
jgi:hypothetical protein